MPDKEQIKPENQPQPQTIKNKISDESEMPSIKRALDSLNDNNDIDSQNSGSADNTESSEAVEDDSFSEVPPFSIEELTKYWQEHIENIRNESPRMYNVLKNQNLILSNDGVILKLLFRNSAQVSEFKSHFKADLVSFIREKSGNDYFEIQEQVVDEEISGSAKYYTGQDKFKYMTTKNPALKKLKNDFNLDIE